MLVAAWKLLFPRTPRSASPTKKKIGRIVFSERGRKWESDLARGERREHEEVSRAMARVLRRKDVNKIWYAQEELTECC